MPDGKTAFDIRDYGAAEDNSAAQNAAAIQQAMEVAGKAVATMSAPPEPTRAPGPHRARNMAHPRRRKPRRISD